MKRFYKYNEKFDEEEQVIVGTAREIRSLVNNLWKRWDEFTPSHCDFPKFNPYKMYGVSIDEDGNFMVLNSDTLVAKLLQ